MNSTSISVEQRLKRLERNNRWLTGALVALCLVIAVLGATGPAKNDDTVRGRQIELIDENGAVRAKLGLDDAGEVGLYLFDASLRERLSLSNGAEETALYLRDDAGDIRVGVAQFAHGGGGFALHGEHAKGATVLYHKGTGSLSFYDDSSGVIYRIPVENGNTGE